MSIARIELSTSFYLQSAPYTIAKGSREIIWYQKVRNIGTAEGSFTLKALITMPDGQVVKPSYGPATYKGTIKRGELPMFGFSIDFEMLRKQGYTNKEFIGVWKYVITLTPTGDIYCDELETGRPPQVRTRTITVA